MSLRVFAYISRPQAGTSFPRSMLWLLMAVSQNGNLLCLDRHRAGLKNIVSLSSYPG